ncbi:MAG: SUMF1/EgtB/PvdO family nonheme iron enzyme [Spirochaetaceae bacterium]|nr:SUMF1/EgtB/PvdO family nonheme iron enzyme [Spirochaetaceae bacterium]
MKQFKAIFFTGAVLAFAAAGCESPVGGGGAHLLYPEGAVEDIIKLPYRAYTGIPKTLSGDVVPDDAVNKTIVWSIISDPDETDSVISGDDENILNAESAGSVWLRATITNGIKSGMDYTKEFSVEVENPPEYGIEVSINNIEINEDYPGHTFGSTSPITVKIQNIGRQATGGLPVTLGGAGSSSFQVSSATVSSIEALGGTGSFTVAPKAGLDPGHHTATVTIDNDNIAPVTFNVSYTISAHQAGTLSVHTVSELELNFRYVPPSYTPFQVDSYDTTAAITKGYWMMETEVTQELWKKIFSEDNPSEFTESKDGGDAKNLPVDTVSWYAAITFCNKLSLTADKTPVYEVEGVDDWEGLEFDDIPEGEDDDWNGLTISGSADGYRLPTELEWLWAAMGASEGGEGVRQNGWKKGYAGAVDESTDNVDDYAWYADNADESTHEVRKKLPNELGIYDMSGNVYEWCQDWYIEWNDAATDAKLADDYAGPSYEDSDGYRMIRGGSWYDSTFTLDDRSMSWEPYEGDMTIGFRIVCNEAE